MKHTKIRDLYRETSEYAGKTVTVAGWVRTLRNQKAFGFIELNDGSCFKGVQIVIDAERLENFAELAAQNVGASLIVSGEVILTPEARQPFEIKASEVLVEGLSSPDYPLQKKKHSLEFLRSIAHLRPRTNMLGAAFRVRSAAAFAIHRFFQDRGFLYAQTPIITCSDAEGAGDMFRVTALDMENPPRLQTGGVDFSKDFFERPASLTVSGQLEGECLSLAFGDIYTFGPTFRAERSNTARHAAEFWMIEPEIAFADLEDDMALARDMMVEVTNEVLHKCPDELAFFNRFVDEKLLDRLDRLVNAEFAVMEYTEAIEVLERVKERFDFPVFWGCDLQTEHERYLTEEVLCKPVFIINYPKEIKAFYMRVNNDGKTVAAMDLLVPGVGEIIGGSQREDRLDVLDQRIRETGLDPEAYYWYRDLRRYGGARHAGFGLGFERYLMYITGIQNIRDVQLFPRVTGSAEF